ncbi:hypothetical protein EVAR_28649_1 [Eumeta japonica]|uniref:Solute carrier family 46 member 3 n=1 Tax=Eumeta variegata TaxID=151549 RepID=A0A4C1ZMC3_EUMVA|nr:hypothetical protein EVAR_28649_1 [Eumeta japonica]
MTVVSSFVQYRRLNCLVEGLNKVLFCMIQVTKSLIGSDPARFVHHHRSADNYVYEKQRFIDNMKTFFDFKNVRDTFGVITKYKPNNRSLRIYVLLLVVTILFGPMYGEMSILYLSTRYRFGWDEVKFSLFSTYNFVIHTLGTVFSITVFSKVLNWHDSVLGIISTVSKIAASFVYCFAPNGRVFFAGPIVEILNGTSLLAMRSIISKLVETDELGKINSIFGLTESLMPLLYVPLYTKVYTLTMKALPGAVFLMGAAMTLPAVVVFIRADELLKNSFQINDTAFESRKHSLHVPKGTLSPQY